MPNKTYLPRKARLLKDFDKSLPVVKQVLILRYGEVETESLIQDSRQKYEKLLPKIPYIGERNPMFTFFLLPASRVLAVYQTLLEQGETEERSGQLIYEIGEAEIQAVPGWMRFSIRRLWFSRWFTQRLQKRAKTSLERNYPGDYVFEYIEGNDQDFDYGIDYLECASCKFFEEQGVPELSPYFCAKDKIASEFFGWGLSRSQTLAEGGERCDFRFKKGGKTNLIIPPSLRQTSTD